MASDYIYLIVAIVGFSIIGAAIVFSPTEGAVPPTNAFSKIIIDGVPITAGRYNDILIINTDGDLVTTIQDKTVTIKLAQMTCPLLQGVKGVDSNGNLICGAV